MVYSVRNVLEKKQEKKMENAREGVAISNTAVRDECTDKGTF
jgi:hypothetical protein